MVPTRKRVTGQNTPVPDVRPVRLGAVVVGPTRRPSGGTKPPGSVVGTPVANVVVVAGGIVLPAVAGGAVGGGAVEGGGLAVVVVLGGAVVVVAGGWVVVGAAVVGGLVVLVGTVWLAAGPAPSDRPMATRAPATVAAATMRIVLTPRRTVARTRRAHVG